MMDYHINGGEWRDAYDAMEADLTAREIGVILWLPKIDWSTTEASEAFYSELQSRRIKLLITPFGPEELLIPITEILKEQGKSLITQEQLKACLEGNRARLKRAFNCSDEDLGEKYQAWISSLETGGVDGQAWKIRSRGSA